MAKDEPTPEQGEQEPAPKKKRALPLTLAILVGVLGGGGAGAFFVGPLVAEHLGGGSPKAEAAAPAAEGHGEHGEEEGAAAPSYIHTVDNLVMNPSGTRGTRFLMLTAAFSVESEEVKKEMEARDPEIRDAVLAVLGSKTVDELTDVAKRDSIKASMRDTVAALFPEGAVKRVFLSQFVIQ